MDFGQSMELQHRDLFGRDPEITHMTLEDVHLKLPHHILLSGRRSHFLHAFVLHIFRMFVSGMTHDYRVPKKLKGVLFQRIGANVRFGNRGRNYAQNGGIFKECALMYQSIPRILPQEISRASTFFLKKFKVVNIEKTFDVFTTALCPNRGVTAHEMKLMIYLLRRISESLLIKFMIDQNCFDYTDDLCDCPSSYYPGDDFSGYSRRMCLQRLHEILERLDMFEQQLMMYPFNHFLN
jgi:hypothetical protein